MSPWTDLYARYNQVDDARRAREQWHAAHQQARAAFDAWSASTVDAVMKAFFEGTARQSVAFEEHTGARVLLKDASDRTVCTASGDAKMRILEMQLHEARLHFYSFSEPGWPPRFYFMPTQVPRRGAHGARRYRTLISVAACQAVPAGDGYELRPLEGVSPGYPSPSIILDDLVFRAFWLLVEEVERVGVAAALPSRLATPALRPAAAELRPSR